MGHTLTTSKLINWISAETGAMVVIAATPSTASLTLIQQCLDAAISQVESYCNVPETYPVDVELAILIHATDLWNARRSINGFAAVGELGVVRVPKSFNATVESLLAPYKRWKLGIPE